MDPINTLIWLAATGEPVRDEVLEMALYDLCDELHACDCERCPVEAACVAAGGKLHKNGKAMLKAVREL